jgi:hypothetical protein
MGSINHRLKVIDSLLLVINCWLHISLSFLFTGTIPESVHHFYVTVQVLMRAGIGDPAVHGTWEQSFGAKSALGSVPHLVPERSQIKGRRSACSA